MSQKPDIKISIEKVCEYVASNHNNDIVLLRQKHVIQWIFGDLSFLPLIVKKTRLQILRNINYLKNEVTIYVLTNPSLFCIPYYILYIYDFDNMGYT